MTCPWCGAPVIIRGNQWECGYCGDHGFLAPVSPPQKRSKTEETYTGLEDLYKSEGTR